MKISYIRHKTFALGSAVGNAAISFSGMTASAVVVGIDTPNGVVQGLGFDSYGRYAHGGLLSERFIPRLLAGGASLFDGKRGHAAASAARNIMLIDEKGGGHGERAGALGLIESALWDGFAKAEGMPLWALLAREYGHANDEGPPAGQTPVYASGGHYGLTGDSTTRLEHEAKNAYEAGFAWFKLKVGGATRAQDDERIDSVLEVAKTPSRVAIDANCALHGADGLERLSELQRLGLRWIEEPVDPLDYAGLSRVADTIATPIATGENSFSCEDTVNLLRYGGLRPQHDKLQLDIALSYGIVELIRVLQYASRVGWSRRDFMPHAGHQLALHACAGLGLGAHETASATGGAFSGVAGDTRIEDGVAHLSDAPGAGIEQKPALYRYFDTLV